MTDPDMADRTYIEPITPEIVAKIIAKERYAHPGGFALLPTMGGQTALNCALSLKKMGVLAQLRRRDDRRFRAGDRQGRGSRTVPRGDDQDRPRNPALASHQDVEPGARRAGRHRPARDHPAELHDGRHRRRHRLQPKRIHRDRRARHRRLADQRGADRGERARLEGIRDGGRPRQGGQLHHRLLDRKHRSDGRSHRRFDHHRAGADADGQGIPDHARRLAGGAARDRRRDRRLERAVRGEPGRRAHDRDRDEPPRLALLRAGLQGDRLSDRQGRRQARGRLHARRNRQRHHRRGDARLVRADDRLYRHQDPALRVREIPRRGSDFDDRDEVGRRGDGDRPHVRRNRCRRRCVRWRRA